MASIVDAPDMEVIRNLATSLDTESLLSVVLNSAIAPAASSKWMAILPKWDSLSRTWYEIKEGGTAAAIPENDAVAAGKVALAKAAAVLKEQVAEIQSVVALSSTQAPAISQLVKTLAEISQSFARVASLDEKALTSSKLRTCVQTAVTQFDAAVDAVNAMRDDALKRYASRESANNFVTHLRKLIEHYEALTTTAVAPAANGKAQKKKVPKPQTDAPADDVQA